MRGALAKLGGPVGQRLARKHATDDAQRLVSNEQQPEVELDAFASTSKPEVVNPPKDRPAKKKSLFVKLLKVKKRFGRHKSTSGSEGTDGRDRKEYETAPEINSTSPATSCSGLFETELDRLIEVEEPKEKTSVIDDVTSAMDPSSSVAILQVTEPVDRGEKAIDSDRVLNDGNPEREVAATSGPEVDDVTTHPADVDDVIQHGDNKKQRKRKRAKRYAKRVCMFIGGRVKR